MADHATLTPRVRGVTVKITSPLGLTFWVARAGARYFITGNPVDGRRRDNATFLHDATVDYRGDPVPRYSRARWRRVARRNALVGVPGSLVGAEVAATIVQAPYGWLGAAPPGWTEVPWDALAQGYGGALAVGLAAWGAPRVYHTWQGRELRRDYVYPTWREVCQILNRRFDRVEARRMVQLPTSHGKELPPGEVQAPVRVVLPPFPPDPGVTRRLERIGGRLGMPGAAVEVHTMGNATWIDVAPVQLPPKRVTLASLREAAESTDLDHPVIGAGPGGHPVTLDYNNDSPHVAISGGPGAGKSNTLAWILGQRMWHGVGVVMIDYKKWSHDWAHGMPRERMAYLYDVQQIHDGLVALGDELMQRRAVTSREELAQLRVLDVVMEEANSTMEMLRAYWTEEKARIKAANRAALKEDPHADVTEPPVQSPAIIALGAVIQMGREFGIHAYYSGQSLSANTFGGTGRDRRESFKIRLLGRWDKATWNMLARGIPYVPCPSKTEVGIWAVVRNGEAVLVRTPHVIDKVDMSYQRALREWVLSGPAQPTDIVCPGVSGQMLSGAAMDAPGVQAVADIPEQRVPLSEAVSRLPGREITLDALRWASKNDGRFPAPAVRGGPGRASLYLLSDLVEWKARRKGEGTPSQ